MSDGRIEFEITADGKKAYASIDEVTKVLEKNGKKWEKDAKDSTDSIGLSFEGMLKKVTAAFSAAAIGKAVLNFGKEAIQAASDLEEVQNVVDVTFGEKGAAVIESWSKKAGTQFGLTETQAKKFTSTLGAMMKSAGMTGDQIIGMSTDMAGLTADMASFYNLDFDTAFQKIRSGISGETEPLKQLGINMSVANLEAFALQQGLGKTFSEMTQGEQVMLRYQYLMQATADAQGDFSRTSDGYANATRRLETALESLKTMAGNALMESIGPLTNTLASMLEKLTTNPDKTVLDEFKEIDLDAQKKIEEIKKTAEEARVLSDVLNDIKNEKTETLEGSPLAKSVEKISKNAGSLAGSIDGFKESINDLGEVGVPEGVTKVSETVQANADATETAATASAEWLDVCKRLVQTIPGLSSIIDTQTGEIRGGKAAVDEYIDSWERLQTNLALIEANDRKRSALDTKFAELDLLNIDKVVAERRVRNARDQLNALYKKYKINYVADDFQTLTAEDANALGISSDVMVMLNNEEMYYEQLVSDLDTATAAYQKQKEAYDEAVVALQEAEDALYSNMTDQEKAALIADKYAQAQQKVKEAVEAAAKATEDYYNSALEKTAQKVNSIANGFKTIQMPEVDDLPKPDEMVEALDSQMKFMQTYQENLQKAKEYGLDPEILAELSDGSMESAKYLQTIADNPAYIEQINERYKAVEQEKKNFSKALTDSTIEVDDAYKQLQKAEEEARDNQKKVEDEIAKNAGQMIIDMANNINANAGTLQQAIDSINTMLASLSIPTLSYGMFNLNGSHAAGLNYVPFDGYLAQLHEGEGILTAEENRVWQNFKANQRGVDYDQLGGVMRDNIKPGGNVYLDGRVVGSVISDMQGSQYRSLQRSGWQG